MRDWSVFDPFRLPLEPDGVFQHAGSSIHWQSDFSSAVFPLDGLAQAADTLEQLGRSPALEGSHLSDLIQQRLAPEFREAGEITSAKQPQQDDKPRNRQRPSDLLRSLRPKKDGWDFKSESSPLNSHTSLNNQSHSMQQKNGALDLKSESSTLEWNLGPSSQSAAAHQPRTMATDQLKHLTGSASVSSATPANRSHQSNQITPSAMNRSSRTGTSSRLPTTTGASVAVPPASGAVRNLIQQRALPGMASSTRESIESGTGISSPFRFDDGRLSSSSTGLSKSISSGSPASPSEVNGAHAFLSPLDLARALQTQVQSGTLTEEQLARWAEKPSARQIEKDVSSSKTRLPLHETSGQASTVKGSLAAALTNHLPARPPLVDVPAPSGPQPHSPTPPPPTEVAESPSTGHVPGVSNTFNVTVHMGSGQEASDQELAERLTRVLVDQARRYGIDV
jgi:hypothetical protein